MKGDSMTKKAIREVMDECYEKGYSDDVAINGQYIFMYGYFKKNLAIVDCKGYRGSLEKLIEEFKKEKGITEDIWIREKNI